VSDPEYRLSDLLPSDAIVDQGWCFKRYTSPSGTYLSRGDRLAMQDGTEYEVTFGGNIEHARLRRVILAEPSTPSTPGRPADPRMSGRAPGPKAASLSLSRLRATWLRFRRQSPSPS
jgi:hypothetical protein